MDQICGRNPSKSEVIVRCSGDEKTERPHRTDKNRTLSNIKINSYLLIYIETIWSLSFDIHVLLFPPYYK